MSVTRTSEASMLATIQAAHSRLWRALDAADEPPASGNPRAAIRALDHAVSALCEHLGAVEQVLYPAARSHAPDEAAADRPADRSLQHVMYRAEQCLWGDARSATGTAKEFSALLRRDLTERCAREERLARAVDDALDEDARRALCAQFAVAVRRSPTRPHPHRPHLGPLDGLALRALGMWDDVLDTLDVRSVDDRRPEPEVHVVDRWSAYVLGTGLPPKTERPAS